MVVQNAIRKSKVNPEAGTIRKGPGGYTNIVFGVLETRRFALVGVIEDIAKTTVSRVVSAVPSGVGFEIFL